MAEVIAENLKAVGIDAKLDPVDRNVYIQKRLHQDFDLLPSLIAGINKHPACLQDSFVYVTGKDNMFFDDIEPQESFLEYTKWFEKGLGAKSGEEAAEAFQKALLAAKEGAWVLIICAQPVPSLSTSKVKGFTWTEADKPVFKYTYIEE